MKVMPYISFNGNCEEAIRFYHSVLGGSLEILRYSDLPADEENPMSETWKGKIMHSCLTPDDGCHLYFGDTWEHSPVVFGTHSVIHLQVNSEKDVYTFVEKMGKGGKITMAAEKTFWNSVYGSLTDKFGVSWGFEFDLEH